MTNNKRSLRKGLLASALCGLMTTTGLVALAPSASAQGLGSFAATGTVVDTNGKPIEGATVTVRSGGQGFTRSATTTKGGAYLIPELQNGDYDFTVEAPGFDAYAETAVHLVAGASSNQFRLGASGGDITVVSKRIKTSDFDLTTTGQVINVADVATRIPVARDLTSVILLTPGTVNGSGSFAGLPSVNGGAISENAYFVNGLNITDFNKGLAPVTIPFEFYQTVEVKTGGFAAEFGRTTGGFTSATTKSGSNEFHGGMLFTWNPNWFRSLAPDTFGSDNDSTRNEAASTSFQLSGPIWKDHLFFYGLYQARDIASSGGGRQFLGDPRTSDVSNPAKYRGTTRGYATDHSPFYAGKIDAVITDGQRLEFTYFNTSGNSVGSSYGDTRPGGIRFDWINNIDGPYTGRSLVHYGGENYVGRYTGVMSKWLTVSAAYGRNVNSYEVSSFNAQNQDIPGAYDARNPLQGQTLTIAGGGRSDSRTIRKFYRADADIYFNLLGSHHVKGGYDREDLTSIVYAVGAGNGTGYTVYRAADNSPYLTPGLLAVGEDFVNQSVYRNTGGFTSQNAAYYLEDSISCCPTVLT